MWLSFNIERRTNMFRTRDARCLHPIIGWRLISWFLGNWAKCTFCPGQVTVHLHCTFASHRYHATRVWGTGFWFISVLWKWCNISAPRTTSMYRQFSTKQAVPISGRECHWCWSCLSSIINLLIILIFLQVYTMYSLPLAVWLMVLCINHLTEGCVIIQILERVSHEPPFRLLMIEIVYNVQWLILKIWFDHLDDKNEELLVLLA